MKSPAQKQNPASRAKPKPSSTSASRGNGIRKRGVRALEGEGSYSATRDYNRHLERALKSSDVGKSAARARRALEGPEGRELRTAEKNAKRGPRLAEAENEEDEEQVSEAR